MGGQYTNYKASNYNDPTLNFGTVEFVDANKYRIGGFLFQGTLHFQGIGIEQHIGLDCGMKKQELI